MSHVATITIDHNLVAADLTDFPVLILNNGDAGWDELYALATEGGGDIRIFKSDDTTELPREIVSFSVSGETGEIHVKYSGTLSSTVDTDIHIYCDGIAADYAATDTYGRNAVWGNYANVWHFQHASGNATGSTSGGTTLTNTGVTYGTGVIGQGAILSTTNGTSNTLLNNSVGAGGLNLAPGNARTITLKFKRTVASMPSFARTLDLRVSSRVIVLDYSSGAMSFGHGGGTAASYTWTPTQDQWYHIVWTVTTGDATRFMLDGTQVATGTYASSGSGTFTQIGNANGATTGGFTGGFTVDEVRFRNSELSNNWITTEYNNQNSPGTFYSVAAVTGTIPQAVTAAADVAALILTEKLFKRTLVAAADASATIATTKSFFRTLTASLDAGSVITSANLLFVTLTASITAGAAITEQTVNAVRLYAYVAAAATTERTLSMKRALTASIEASATTGAVKTFFQALTASITGAATVTGFKTFYQTLTAAIGTAATVTRGAINRSIILSAIMGVTAKLNEYFYKEKYAREDEDYAATYSKDDEDYKRKY